MIDRFKQSELLLQQALTRIPFGAQTFSKSYTQFPVGVSPHFIESGYGAEVTDVDGNQYIDLVNGLLTVILGYCDADVDQAVTQQLARGINFSLACGAEFELAELLSAIIPSAEMVQFAKNGSDVTTAAIRVARAYTQREHVALCGYHGWQDWSIGTTTRDLGVPKRVKQLSHRFIYNDIVSLQALFDRFPGQIAAVILEPMTFDFPTNNFLQKVKQLAHKNNAVLIFDEMATGFRFAPGGAQALFGVTPDLTCLGKGMANGLPLAALVGRREFMSMITQIFFSSTFGGEALSLVGGLACVNKIINQKVCDNLQQKGGFLLQKLQNLVAHHQLENIIDVKGHPSWSSLFFSATEQYSTWQLKTFCQQQLIAHGILSLGSHNLSFAHTMQQIDSIILAYDKLFAQLKIALAEDNLLKQLHGDILQPLFSVRD